MTLDDVLRREGQERVAECNAASAVIVPRNDAPRQSPMKSRPSGSTSITDESGL